MSGLPRNWRLSVNNQSGVNVDVTVTARLGRFTSAGLAEWTAEQTVYTATAIASSTTAWTTGTAQDNSSTPYLWADLTVSVTPASSATLNCAVQIEASTDAGTTWPRQGGGRGVGTCLTPSAVTGAQRYTRQVR